MNVSHPKLDDFLLIREEMKYIEVEIGVEEGGERVRGLTEWTQMQNNESK